MEKIKSFASLCIVSRCLKALGILSKMLQEEDLCIVRAIEAFLRRRMSLNEIKTTVKKVSGQIQQKDVSSSSTTVTYQGTDLHSHLPAVSSLSKDYKVWLDGIDTCKCVISRLQAQEEKLVLYTHAMTGLGWERTTSPSFRPGSLEAICHRFSVPLEIADIDIFIVQDEWDDMILYSKQYFDLVQHDYKTIWWKPLIQSASVMYWVLLNYCFAFYSPMVTYKTSFHS